MIKGVREPRGRRVLSGFADGHQNPRRVPLARHDLIGQELEIRRGVLQAAPHQPLDAGDGRLRKIDGGVLGGMTNDGPQPAIRFLLVPHRAGNKRLAGLVRDHPGPAFIADGHEAVGGAQIDAENDLRRVVHEPARVRVVRFHRPQGRASIQSNACPNAATRLAKGPESGVFST